MLLAERLRLAVAHERRQDPRYEVPTLTLVAGPDCLTALDWSIGGTRVKQPERKLKPYDRLVGRLCLAGERRTGDFVAEVARLTEAGEVGLRWLELRGPIAAAMA